MVYIFKTYETRVNRWLMQKEFKGDLSKFESVDLFVSFNNLVSNDSLEILNILKCLETISGQKAVIVNEESKYVGSTKRFFFSARVTLRGTRLLKFLNYFSLVALPNDIKRYGLKYDLNLTKDTKDYTVCLQDLGIFYGYKFENFDGNIHVKFSVKNNVLKDLLKLYKIRI